ncbi:LysE family translocator [Lysobacter korlensis]|uniref:LysE family translocator n=1 Tax=Lysobacter korlensis TaxID=553636 RepID=A0ABV6RW68_9GAMM
MVAESSIINVVVVALTLVLTPGPNMLYLVSRTMTQGRRAGFISLAGVGAGYVLHLIAATAGLAAVFAAVPVGYTVLRIMGAAFLLYLAWQAVRPRRNGVEPAMAGELRVDRPARLFAMGMVTNLLNPKIAILYVSILPHRPRTRAGRTAEPHTGRPADGGRAWRLRRDRGPLGCVSRDARSSPTLARSAEVRHGSGPRRPCRMDAR